MATYVIGVAIYVTGVAVPLYNRVMWLVSQSNFFNYAIIYLASCVCIQTSMVAYVHLNTSFPVSNFIKNVLSLTWSGNGSDYRN